MNIPAMRKMPANGNGCLYLTGNRTDGNVLIIRHKRATTPGGKEERNCPHLEPSRYKVIIKRMQYLSGFCYHNSKTKQNKKTRLHFRISWITC